LQPDQPQPNSQNPQKQKGREESKPCSRTISRILGGHQYLKQELKHMWRPRLFFHRPPPAPAREPAKSIDF
jgi:hypothetical protein